MTGATVKTRDVDDRMSKSEYILVSVIIVCLLVILALAFLVYRLHNSKKEMARQNQRVERFAPANSFPLSPMIHSAAASVVCWYSERKYFEY